jgi:hypothetical protein
MTGFTFAGRKTADNLTQDDWIICHGQYSRVLLVDEQRIITTGGERARFGSGTYEYAVYTQD